MKLETKREKKTRVIKENKEKFVSMVRIAVRQILNQKGGCYSIEDIGVAYYDPVTKKKDAIAALLPDMDFSKREGLISHESNKDIINKLITRYDIDLTYDTQYSVLVDFLQNLQDGHDFAFEDVKGSENGITDFIRCCNEIVTEFGGDEIKL